MSDARLFSVGGTHLSAEASAKADASPDSRVTAKPQEKQGEACLAPTRKSGPVRVRS